MHKKIALFSTVAAIAIPFAPIFAQTANTTLMENRTQMRTELQTQKQENQVEKNQLKGQIQTNKEGLKQKRLEFQDKREKMTQDRCKNIETKIATRTGRYENTGQMLQTVYTNMQARLERLSTSLKDATDTSKLDADLATLYAKISKLKADQATILTTLKDSQTLVCEKTELEFKTKFTQARSMPEILKQDRADIKNFFQTTIKADLQAIRQQLALQKEATVKTGTIPQTIQ